MNNERYLDPPDEDEAEFCQVCNEEMELKSNGLMGKNKEMYWACNNTWCPDKFIPTSLYIGGTVIEMAKKIVELEQELADAKADLRYADARIINLKTLNKRMVDDRPVPRDVEYQIKRMEDAIDLLYLEGIGAQSAVKNEWQEVKKILTNL